MGGRRLRVGSQSRVAFREPVHDFVRFHFAKSEGVLRAAGAKLLTIRGKA